MVREVVTVNVGQAGIQMSNAVWAQYCAEHKISSNGFMLETDDAKDDEAKSSGEFTTFFSEASHNRYVPRNISIDLEPNVIDDVRNGPFREIFHPEYLIAGKEDAANNFARGHYTVGRDMIDEVHDRIRRLTESCESLQGFVINHAVGGGTGSGLGALILEKISVHYRKQNIFGFEVFPSEHTSTSVVEPYNALLATSSLVEHSGINVVLDNEAMWGISKKNLGISRPGYDNLNRLVSKVISSMTASLRFPGELNVDLDEFKVNLVPFPRLHFMTTSLAPVIPVSRASHARLTVQSITDECFQPSNHLVHHQYSNDDDRYMAICLNYRGDVRAKDVNAAIDWIKKNGKAPVVEWSPTPFKVGLNDQTPALVQGDDMAPTSRSVAMTSNTTSIRRVFSERIMPKFDLMYSQRAFVHWYVGEGMEEGEFSEAREELAFLEKDYLDLLEECTSEEDEDSDDSY